MKKKILSLALALVLCLGLAVPVFAETMTKDGITITTTPDGTISCTGKGVLTDEHLDIAIELLDATMWGRWNGINTITVDIGPGITSELSYEKISKLNELNEWFSERAGYPVKINFPSVAQTVGGFTDVKPDDYFADPVMWAVGRNITAGTSKTTFSPNENCTVAQILTFLWRAYYSSQNYYVSNPFSDVKISDYYYNAALWAYKKGMVTGSTFGGDKPCTRAMAVTYMWKAAGSPAASYDGRFDDVPATADYASAVAWAVENEVTSGTSATTFSPDSVCTRGQIVTFLHRALAK